MSEQTSLVVEAIEDIQRGVIRSYAQRERGDLYPGKMMSVDIIEEAWAKTEDGIIQRYLKEKEERDEKVIKMIESGDG